MGRQSSRIYWQGQDHKEMVTWDGSKYQYHDKAYIWNGTEFELVWEKLYDPVYFDVVDEICFSGQSLVGVPYVIDDYFVGADPLTISKKNKIDRVSHVKTTAIGDTDPCLGGASADGQLLYARNYSSYYFGETQHINLSTSMIYSKQSTSFPTGAAESYTNMGDIFPKYAYGDGVNIRNSMIQQTQWQVFYQYTSIYTGHNDQYSIYHTHNPTSEINGAVYTQLAMKDFYNYYAIAVSGAGSTLGICATYAEIDNYQSSLVSEIELSDIVGEFIGSCEYKFENGLLQVKYNNHIYLIDVENESLIEDVDLSIFANTYRVMSGQSSQTDSTTRSYTWLTCPLSANRYIIRLSTKTTPYEIKYLVKDRYSGAWRPCNFRSDDPLTWKDYVVYGDDDIVFVNGTKWIDGQPITVYQGYKITGL